MILTQNSLVLSTNELDALETGTYKDRTEIVLCGSSMCRSTTSIPKLKTNYLTAKEKDNYSAIYDKLLTDVAPLSAIDMPEFSHFERNVPLKIPGRGIHKMSQRTKTKIRQKITAWSHTKRNKSNLKFTFVTLTLTSKQIGTDKDYSKMLNTFFTYLRKFYPFKNYLYVNERQTKNTNNIHSHIITDIYLPIQRINYIWCKILSENGYMFNGLPIFSKETKMPNPVDISSIYDLKKVSTYVTKYITKNDSEFDSLIWNCSNTVSRLFTSVKMHSSSTFYSLYEHFRHTLTVKCTNGEYLHINLLSLYHGLQKKHFHINNEVLNETLDRQRFIKQLNEKKCRLQPLLLA